LDLNLEKGRIREEANVQELKIKETETRIEQETAQLRERLEAVKFSTLQWLMYVNTLSMLCLVDRTLLTYLQGRLYGHSSSHARCMAFADVKQLVQPDILQTPYFGMDTEPTAEHMETGQTEYRGLLPKPRRCISFRCHSMGAALGYIKSASAVHNRIFHDTMSEIVGVGRLWQLY
jgi:hypothetical protein